jgi:transposase-like protein
MADLRNTLFSVLTGRQADVSGQVGGDVPGMLMAIGGASSRTKSGIDLTRAAGQLGVSRRTVERWVKTAQTGSGQKPSARLAKVLAAKARQAATTKAGRKAALAGSPLRQAITSRGARVAIDGMQGPHAAGQDYVRKRVTQLDLDPADAEAMLNAWEQGGEKGFMSWASSFWDNEYLADWKFDSIDSITIERPQGGTWR